MSTEKLMKLTAWNIENLATPLNNPDNTTHQSRLMKISQQVLEMDADVLCIGEAPVDPRLLRQWADKPVNQGGLGGQYKVAVIGGTWELFQQYSEKSAFQRLRNLYATSGKQWIWFMLKTGFYENHFVRVQAPSVWQSFTGLSSWNVHYWGNHEKSTHKHYRHPQVLILNLDGKEVEIIGVHLKSKINTTKAFEGDKNQLTKEHINEALMARIKMTTEALDIRMYIDQRFEQEEEPLIIVCGDMNDGPGKEFFERKFLYFDLLSNIQGDVFFAKRFLNHGLFDYAEHLRWTARFSDSVERWALKNFPGYNQPSSPIDVTNFQLIDHILFTQGFVAKTGTGPRIRSKAGYIEHLIHERLNGKGKGTSATRTSDHRAVSVEVVNEK